MATPQPPVSELLVIVKTREIQRAMFAEHANDRDAAQPHFLAAAHLELVLADDYADAGNDRLAFRARLSAASCLWRGGDEKRARSVFKKLAKDYPHSSKTIKESIAELEDSSR